MVPSSPHSLLEVPWLGRPRLTLPLSPQVFRKLASYKGCLLSSPSTVLKTWARYDLPALPGLGPLTPVAGGSTSGHLCLCLLVHFSCVDTSHGVWGPSSSQQVTPVFSNVLLEGNLGRGLGQPTARCGQETSCCLPLGASCQLSKDPTPLCGLSLPHTHCKLLLGQLPTSASGPQAAAKDRQPAESPCGREGRLS